MKFHSSKYHAKKVVIDGIKFASKKEGDRYKFLLAALQAGEIDNLQMQVKHNLLPAQYEIGTFNKNGVLKRGKCLERQVDYISDFEYDANGKHVIEDVKGVLTKEYILKRKMLLFFKDLRIREVKKWNEPI